ncbi:MAG TPA: FlgD immunoglobulin-like domain containing protein, partial [Candidatus Krumholzibacteria bacterium]|nr:FlgD immunoglobulin-like domain containing protein [Candidatus Krumholzibacteria bacterium]
YSDVFHGRSDDLEGSGFDEALQVHQATGVPGNFHLSGPLQSSAEWSARNGDPVDFNAWLAAGVGAGWAGMITSAYGQHIMPFVQNAMNDWSVEVQAQMTNTRYGYVPRVAWVPERVWLNTSGYPSSGVSDWIGDNWQGHGVDAVILDDDVHLAGHDNHQIHFLAANGLRLVPRDRSFTGNILGGNGQASLDILTSLAGSGVGEYRIAVLAEDWEAVSEMGGWASIVPNAKETYDWFVGKCATESAWLSTWKLADALANPNFNGDSFTPAPGTYNEIGGTGGYGGGDNGWYTHWAGWVPYANGGDGNGGCAGLGGNCKNYGTLWNDAYGALMAAPDNNISQAGWYVLMTNLHETAWHDYLGGPISGWQHKYSAHIKNAMIYAEAAHWAAGEYATTTNAYTSDIDNDGFAEAIVHNDRLFGVFEGNGGRLTHLFVKGPGYDDTAIGVDNAYWADTEGDYNDVNHVGAFSDVSPNYQHDGYGWTLGTDGATAWITLVHNEVSRTITLAEGDAFMDAVYRVGPATHWVQAGFSPSLVDLVWNAEMTRVWAPDAAYMGQRNPNTGIATAWVVGSGGAAHQRDFTGTLMKGDEIRGAGVFQVRLFAGATSAPDGSGDVAELRAMVGEVVDSIGPAPTDATWFPATGRLQLTFDQVVASADAAGVTLAAAGGGGSVTLPGGTPAAESGAALTRTYAVDGATAAAIDALGPNLVLALAAGAMVDGSGVGSDALDAAAAFPVAVAATAIAIDGNVEAGEWAQAQVLADSSDSQWTSANEIDRLLVDWDDEFLYIAIDGQVSGNSWLLYLDVDPGSGNGPTDLSAIDAWERGAVFTAPGFAPDFQYGCYQHQSIYDGDGFWQLLSATTAQDRGGEITSAFDSQHVFGAASGSELAIPWNTLYGLGAGHVPAGAQVALVASICWDPEPSGVLGGDVAPDNTAAALPTVDGAWTLTVDADGDGRPDGGAPSAVPMPAAATVRLLPNVPNPFNPSTTVRFVLPGSAPSQVDLSIFDVRGRLVTTLVRGALPAGEHAVVWNGRAADGRPAPAGTYFSRLKSGGQVDTRPLCLVK